MNEDKCSDLSDRLKGLEIALATFTRRARWWTRFGHLVLVCVITLALGGAQRGGIPATIDAETFNLRDTEGRFRAQLRLDPTFKQPIVTLFDPDNQAVAAPFHAALDKEGMPYIWLGEENTQSGILMSVGENGDGLSFAVHRKGKNGLHVAAKPRGSTNVYSVNNDKVRFAITDHNGTVGLTLFANDKESRPQLKLSVGPDGAPELGLTDKIGKVLFRAPTP